MNQVKLGQLEDEKLTEFAKKSSKIVVDSDGVMRFRGRLCMPKDDVLKRSILEETHRLDSPSIWSNKDVPRLEKSVLVD